MNLKEWLTNVEPPAKWWHFWDPKSGFLGGLVSMVVIVSIMLIVMM